VTRQNPKLEQLMGRTRKAQTEDRWLDMLTFLVNRLSPLTGGSVDIGRYWIFNAMDSDGSISARVRAKRPFPGIDSDYWEAAVCLSSDATSVWSDTYLFPFLRNSTFTSRGRLADGGNKEEFWWLSFENDEWRQEGWMGPDGPGEWSWVTEPGDEFLCNLDCQPANSVVSEHTPLFIDIQFDDFRKFYPGQQSNPDSDIIRLSLVHVHRGHEGMNLAPWGEHPPKTKSPHVVPLRWSKDVRQNQCRIDLSKWSIRGGWVPGKYYLTLRAQFAFGEPGNWISEISSPIRLQIAE
jgi:hypothetical protein